MSSLLGCGDSDGGSGSASNSGDGSSAESAADMSASEDASGSADASDPTIADASGDASGHADSGSSDGSSSADSSGGGGQPVDLGMAGQFAILAKSGISNVPPSDVTGDVGVSPAAASFITGFSLSADATNVFSTSAQVTGSVFAADYEPPTPITMTTAIGDMELAFTDAAGRAPDVTELGAGNIGGMTLDPGVYAWGTGLLIPTDLTLDGTAHDVWIFQVAQDLTVGNGAHVVLTGGAIADNVFWQVGGLVDLGTTSHCEGVVLSATSARLGTGASVVGRLLAQTAVTLDGNTVVESSQ
jgi:Ice-binding-like